MRGNYTKFKLFRQLLFRELPYIKDVEGIKNLLQASTAYVSGQQNIQSILGHMWLYLAPVAEFPHCLLLLVPGFSKVHHAPWVPRIIY